MTDDALKTDMPLADATCFIEQQFPVSKLSMESYKERKANYSQTLTGLGKWWGRKPLVLVRAALLGLLMPASEDPEKDREVFLKLMTMDREGLCQRKSKPIPGRRLVEELLTMSPLSQRSFLETDGDERKPELRTLSRDDRQELQRIVFDRMSYDEKLKYCDRPEQIEGPSPEAWDEINAHLGTNAHSLQELVEELGRRRFGHRPRVGDAFCGGGSIPFEAARLGCDAYGADLNPVAAFLTWASLNIVGGGSEVAEAVRTAQKRVYDAVDEQITDWGIEHNGLGWRANAYLYCVEVIDPESGWLVPLIPNPVIGHKTRTVARLVPDERNHRYEIEILEGVSGEALEAAKVSGTIKDSRLVPPKEVASTPISVVRRSLRLWEKEDIVPRHDDIFQERLYCIRWVETYIDDTGKERTRRHYRAPTIEDLNREGRVLQLLQERFSEWQQKGFVPKLPIPPGYNTDQPIRERGWTQWHHLFTPRQLLMHGLFQQVASELCQEHVVLGGMALGIARCVDWNGRLCRWDSSAANEKVADVFSNQALNTQYSYAGKGLLALASSWFLKFSSSAVTDSAAKPQDARQTSCRNDIWITDPPYADAVNYHELADYFLAWYEEPLRELFPKWYSDSRRALAVRGSDENFRESMVDSYKRLADMMPGNGLQVVMFTHQDAAVWADLTMILWAAGLRVTAAWSIATETDSGLKKGNYVQGTVLLVLRKRTETEAVFLDEIIHEIEAEVRRQLDSMLAMEDNSDPNFGDADYQLAAYAAALRVLTAQPIEEIDPAREILRERNADAPGPVELLIRNAVKIACDHLVPRGFNADFWKRLSPMERFYLKGLEVESHGEYRNGVYQELARGFGAAQYADLLASTQANETRLKSASELGRRNVSGGGFGDSLVRQCLFAVHLVVRSEETQDGLNWFKTELPDYWSNRERIVHMLEFFAELRHVSTMEAWRRDGRAAGLLAGAVRNDHV